MTVLRGLLGSAVQDRIPYTLEIMKGGAVLGKTELETKDHWTFGRHPRSDFVLEHPSASRLHAVLQFRGTDAQGFLFDAGSAHGSFLNKQRLPPREHTPIRSGGRSCTLPPSPPPIAT